MKQPKFVFALKCFLSLSMILFFAYKYVDTLNLVTSKRLEIPKLQKKLKRLEEENIRLQYEVDKLENPAHLMHLSRRKEFQYLHYPAHNEVIILSTETVK